MKTIYQVSENLKIIGNDKVLYLLCPMNYSDGNLTSDDLLKGFANTIKMGATGDNKYFGNHQDEKKDERTIRIVLSKDFEGWESKKKRDSKYDRGFYQRIGKIVNKMKWENYLDIPTIRKQRNEKQVTNGKANEKTAVRTEIRTAERIGNKVRLYQLPKGIDRRERTRMNANILFNDMFLLVQKEAHIVIINEVANGGVCYMHNKGHVEEKLYHQEAIIKAVSKVLNEELEGDWKVTPIMEPTYSEQGALVKFPFSITKKKPNKNIGITN